MHDDQRPVPQTQIDDEDDRFDEALDHLTGSDEGNVQNNNPERAQPLSEPSASAASQPDPDDAMPDREFPRSPAPVTAKRPRDWRRIACFGCLAAVGIPALLLLILVVLGYVTGDDGSESPPSVDVMIDPDVSERSARARTTGDETGIDFSSDLKPSNLIWDESSCIGGSEPCDHRPSSNPTPEAG